MNSKKSFAIVKLVKQTFLVEAESKTDARERMLKNKIEPAKVETVYEQVEPVKLKQTA